MNPSMRPSSPTEKPFISRRRFILVIVGLLSLSGGAMYWFNDWADRPVTQDIRVSATQAEESAQQVLSTKYYKTLIPDGFHISTAVNPNAPDMIQTSLFGTKGRSRQVGITTDRLPVGGLSELGDYNFRAKSPAEYSPYKFDGMPSGSKAFKKADGSEMTLFTSSKNRYASITASGGVATAEQQEALLIMISINWQWIGQ